MLNVELGPKVGFDDEGTASGKLCVGEAIEQLDTGEAQAAGPVTVAPPKAIEEQLFQIIRDEQRQSQTGGEPAREGGLAGAWWAVYEQE